LLSLVLTFALAIYANCKQAHGASEAQIKLAAPYDYLVPPGFTFVRPSPTTDGDDDSVSALRQEFRSISLLNLLFNV